MLSTPVDPQTQAQYEFEMEMEKSIKTLSTSISESAEEIKESISKMKSDQV